MKDIARLEIAVHDAVLVQVMHAGRDTLEPPGDFCEGHARGVVGDHVLQAGASHVFHHDPALAVVVDLDVPQVNQIGVLEVQTLADAAELDFQIASDSLEGDLFTRVADRKIDLPEAAYAQAAFDRVPLQGGRTTGERKPHPTNSLCDCSRYGHRVLRPLPRRQTVARRTSVKPSRCVKPSL